MVDISGHELCSGVVLERLPTCVYYEVMIFIVYRHIGKDIGNTFAKLEKLAICKLLFAVIIG